MKKYAVLIVSGCFLFQTMLFAQGMEAQMASREPGAKFSPQSTLTPLLLENVGTAAMGVQALGLAEFPPLTFTNSSNPYDERTMARRAADALVAMGHPKTKIAPSHWGHPGYQDVAFLYDKAVDALVLKAAGNDQAARDVLDYFSARLRIPMAEVRKYSDANGIYGILKLVPSVDDPRAVGLVNAFDRSSTEPEGRALLEYWTTPGPLAFMIMAFLAVDRERYLADAVKIGEALLVMQREDGAITDGDRNAENVHTEPHMDTFSAFLQLAEATGDPRWQAAAEKAWTWFLKNVYQPDNGVIYQGMRKHGPSEIFATDTYSWTMVGPGGDRIPLDVLEKMTDRMLRQSVSRVTLELPDGKTKTVTLVDFADVQDMRITADRGGFHPMGSVEWIGGVILALQKNAVRFWEAGDDVHREKAKFYKALAERFTREALSSFYEVDGLNGLLSFYATGQWIGTGHGWQTPYFYVKDAQGNPVLKGGSSIGAWPVLPITRSNPFRIQDTYGFVYDEIPLGNAEEGSDQYVSSISEAHAFAETVPTQMAEGVDEIPEMWRYNQNMFTAFNAGNYYAAILWAEKVVKNPAWMASVRDQQKRKEKEFGGIIDYPWGTPLEQAKDKRSAIQRYPLLNEAGTAMWGMAVSNYRLGNETESKAWIRSLIETAPLHQIYAPNGPGFWNALVSWETNPGGTPLDDEMGRLYRDVLKDMGLTSAMPKAVSVK